MNRTKLHRDVNKGETINYNDLNKVSSITTTSNGSVVYTYDASGTRIRKVVYNGSGVLTSELDYIDGFVYSTNSASTPVSLMYFSMAEGRVNSNTTATTFVYEYFIKDHIGNTRASFQDNGSGVAQMTQENEYYAFGMTMLGIVQRTAPNPAANKHLYNGGSELQGDFGDENYSTPLREYDPQIGRFNAIDMMVDKYASWTPYNFSFNDPVSLNDPSGADPENQYRMQQAAYDAKCYAQTQLGVNVQKGMDVAITRAQDEQRAYFNDSYNRNKLLSDAAAWQNDQAAAYQNYMDATQARWDAERAKQDDINKGIIHLYKEGTGIDINKVLDLVTGAFSAIKGDASESYLIYLAHSIPGNKYRMEGTLYLFSDGGLVATDSWSANTGATYGTGGKPGYPIPEGEYTVTAPFFLNPDGSELGKSYTRDGESFKMHISDICDPLLDRMRTGLEIHPCAKLGTMGCIGLTGSASQIQDFLSQMFTYFTYHSSIKLNVFYVPF